jgi:hypothetical protein
MEVLGVVRDVFGGKKGLLAEHDAATRASDP